MGAGLVTRWHLPRTDQVAVSALAASATFFTLLAWDVLSDDASAFLVPLFWVCVFTAAVGLALRTVSAPLLLVPVTQALVAALLLHHLWAGGTAVGGWVPTPTSLGDAVDVLANGARQASQWPAPVPVAAHDFPAVMLATGTVVALLVDLLACTLRRVPASGLPLLAAFTVPVSLVGGVSWMVFALGALSFTLLLTADQAARLGRWGHTLTPVSYSEARAAGGVVDNQPHQVRLGTLWPSASRFAVAGVAAAVLAPVALPGGLSLFEGDGPGDGTGPGNEVTLTNPMVSMQRRLTREADIPLVTIHTEDPDPGYLRLTVLDDFNGTEWTPANRDLPPSQRADGPLPLAPGQSPDTPHATYLTRIDVSTAFGSTWLPAPYPAARIRVPGDWRYDLDTLDFHSADKKVTTAGLSYQVDGEVLKPDPAALVAAPPAPRQIFAPYTELPSTVPPWIVDLAQSVTAKGRSQFEKAVMLQRWFRTDGGFTYSTDRASGSGLDQLELFLGTGDGSRVGYCEQFSSAMAMLARALGIPARVAVGFLRPDPRGHGDWVYSSHDLHAWPELYFQGTGWVRFEPTPQDQAAEVPSYTTGRVPGPADLPTTDTSATPLDEKIKPSASVDKGTTSASDGAQGHTPTWPLAAGGVLVLGGLLALPRVVRGSRRRRRLAPAGGGRARSAVDVAEDAWAEVRATALDLALGWDDGSTLRQRARALAASLDGERGAQPARAALERLVLLLEQARYSRRGLEGHERDVQDAAGEVLRSLHARATPTARRRAAWLPASLWQEQRVHGSARRGISGAASTRPVGDLDRLSV